MHSSSGGSRATSSKDESVGVEPVGRALNVIAGPVPQHRLVVTVGKVAVSDVFDVNSFASNPGRSY